MALKLFDMQSIGRGAAIIVEPVISAGGVLVPPHSFMQALRQAADDRGMLLIFDGRRRPSAGSARGLGPSISAWSRTS
ncbi:aminotransferase class III-fold pyridoxal phosphate-dependent enzyme [uncultured Enterovirga sp.]|uniref:aminotransferase class III-fold pyridoxal phosphate-dependent enzyme n=1 Tax=uncultured Enterovirga sp. TaxID=2026352 RepID=UPI0035C94900